MTPVVVTSMLLQIGFLEMGVPLLAGGDIPAQRQLNDDVTGRYGSAI